MLNLANKLNVAKPGRFVSGIAVFDSGLGSLSVVRALRRAARGGGRGGARADVIYFADTASFPYGSKSKPQLERIIRRTMEGLQREFRPDAMVVASNTPTLVLDIRDGYRGAMLVAGVRPPLAEAAGLSGTGRIAVLGTAAGIRSAGLSRLIQRDAQQSGRCRVFRVDGSELVGMVESGAFLKGGAIGPCREAVRRVLGPAVSGHGVDVVVLSSTHLPFLLRAMESEYPGVTFVDPARRVAEWVLANYRGGPSGRNRLRIYASGGCSALQEKLARLGVRRVVRPLSL